MENSPKSIREKLKYGFTLFILTTIITSIVLFINLIRSDINNYMDVDAWIYFILAIVGQSAMLAFAIYLIYILNVTILKLNKSARVIFIAMAILLQIFIILDGLVFSIYRFHINGFVLELILGAGSEVFVFDFWLYFRFIFLVFITAVVPYLVANKIASKFYTRIRKKGVLTATIFLLICLINGHVTHAIAAAVNKASIQKSATVIPLFFPLTMNRLLTKIGIKTQDDDLDDINKKNNTDVLYPLTDLKLEDSIPEYNIVYLLIDSWNPSTFDSIVTPNIYNFSKKGHYFNNHYSSSYGTRGGLFGLFYGASLTYEKEFGISKTTPVLVDQLVERQYNIQAFPSANFTMPPFHKMFFRHVKDINTKTEGATPFDRDERITEMAIDFIAEQKNDKPFFSFIFYDLAHAISIPENYRTKFTPSWEHPDYMALNNDIDRTPFFNLYKNCVYHIDHLIGRVLTELENKDMLDKTIIIITSDHGQEFNENKKNFWGHGSNFTEWQLKVPFILYYPSIEGNKTYSHMTTHYDVSASIVHQFLGVENPISDYSMGYDIYSTSSRYPHVVGSVVNFGFIMDNIITNTNHIGSLEITDAKLNTLPRSALDTKVIREALQKKNYFYKK